MQCVDANSALRRSRILDALDLQTVKSAEITEEHAAIFEAARPTADQITTDRWVDDAALPPTK